MLNEQEGYLLTFLVKFMNEKYPEKSKIFSVKDALKFIRSFLGNNRNGKK